MNKNGKIYKGIKIGIIVLGSIIVLAIVIHLTINSFVPLIGNMHNNGGAY